MKRLFILLIALTVFGCKEEVSQAVSAPKEAEGVVEFKVGKRGRLVIVGFDCPEPCRMDYEVVRVEGGKTLRYDASAYDVITYAFFDEKGKFHYDTANYVLILKEGKPKPTAYKFLAYALHYTFDTTEFLNLWEKGLEVYPESLSFMDNYYETLLNIGRITKDSIKAILKGGLKSRADNITFLYGGCLTADWVVKDTALANAFLRLLREKFPGSPQRYSCEVVVRDTFFIVGDYLSDIPQLRSNSRWSFVSHAMRDSTVDPFAFLKAISPRKRFFLDYSALLPVLRGRSDDRLGGVVDSALKLAKDSIRVFVYGVSEGSFTATKRMNVFSIAREMTLSDVIPHWEKVGEWRRVYEELLSDYERLRRSRPFRLRSFAKAAYRVGDTVRFKESLATLLFLYRDTSLLDLAESLGVDTSGLRKLVRFDTLPDIFKAVTLDGDTITKGDLRGKRVVLNFWATWCKPCVDEIPLLNRLVASSHRDVLFLAITSEDPDVVKKFLKEHEFRYTVAIAPKEVFQKLLINGYPTHLVLSREGHIVMRKLGALSEEDLRALSSELSRSH